MTILQIEYPEDLLSLDTFTKEKLELLARELLLVRLYSIGVVSSGKAAEVLGISRREFLDVLGEYHVSEFDEDLDLIQELTNAAAAYCE